MSLELSELIWSQKYRPKSITDCILPSELKQHFLKCVEQKHIPNSTFYGTAGLGKTSVALALMQDIGAEFLFIESAIDGNIETLRTKIRDFATTVSLINTDVKKYVIFDEGDRLTAATQDALKSFIETYSVNCGFIITSNHINKMITPLLSRCPGVSFEFPADEREVLITEQFKKTWKIVQAEHADLDKSYVGQVIIENYPDFRIALNELQSIKQEHKSANIAEVIGFLKSKSYDKIRAWVAQNAGNPQLIMTAFYSNVESLVRKETIPTLVLILAEYQYKASFVLDQEINLAAMFAQIMMEIEWK